MTVQPPFTLSWKENAESRLKSLKFEIETYSLQDIQKKGVFVIKSEIFKRYKYKLIRSSEGVLKKYKNEFGFPSTFEIDDLSDREFPGKILLYNFNLSKGSDHLKYRPTSFISTEVDYHHHFTYIITDNPEVTFKIYIKTGNENLFEKEKQKIQTFWQSNLAALNSDIEQYNHQVEKSFQELFEEHRLNVEKEEDFYKEIGIGIVKGTDSLLIPIPINIDKAPESENLAKKDNPKLTPVNIISNETYEDIITVLKKFYNLVGQRPSMYENKKEPDLRDLIIPLLQIRYHKTNVTAETFISKGKTDLLIQDHDHNNIFVAEYKIWSGQKDLLEALKQLFGYTTVRETKTALVVFDKSKSFGRMQKTAQQAMKDHPNFKSIIEEKGYTKFIFTHPHDEDAIIYIALLCFHLKKIAD